MQMLDTKEAAKSLNTSPNTLAQWRYQKRGPKFIKIGALVRYRQSDLDAYIEQQTKTGTSLTRAQSY